MSRCSNPAPPALARRRPRDGALGTAPSGRRPAWHLVSSVAELRLAEEYVLRQARSISRWPREVGRLEDALAVLIVCGRETALSHFIDAGVFG